MTEPPVSLLKSPNIRWLLLDHPVEEVVGRISAGSKDKEDTGMLHRAPLAQPAFTGWIVKDGNENKGGKGENENKMNGKIRHHYKLGLGLQWLSG